MSSGSYSSMKRLFGNQLSGWPISEVLSWLLTKGRQIEPTTHLIGELFKRLVEAGAPLIRVRIFLLTLHPLVRDFSFTWYRGRSTEMGRAHHGIEDTASYIGSPWEHVFSTGQSFRRRLDDLQDNRGGEVLKFIGDAVLTIFPTSTHDSIESASVSAVEAAVDTFASLGPVNFHRRRDGLVPISFCIALHQGTVIYGNVGAPERLDFTVMGTAVNRTARLEALTKTLGHSLLMSAEFANCISRPVRSLGHHQMAGVAETQEIFTLTEME